MCSWQIRLWADRLKRKSGLWPVSLLTPYVPAPCDQEQATMFRHIDQRRPVSKDRLLIDIYDRISIITVYPGLSICLWLGNCINFLKIFPLVVICCFDETVNLKGFGLCLGGWKTTSQITTTGTLRCLSLLWLINLV